MNDGIALRIWHAGDDHLVDVGLERAVAAADVIGYDMRLECAIVNLFDRPTFLKMAAMPDVAQATLRTWLVARLVATQRRLDAGDPPPRQIPPDLVKLGTSKMMLWVTGASVSGELLLATGEWMDAAFPRSSDEANVARNLRIRVMCSLLQRGGGRDNG